MELHAGQEASRWGFPDGWDPLPYILTHWLGHDCLIDAQNGDTIQHDDCCSSHCQTLTGLFNSQLFLLKHRPKPRRCACPVLLRSQPTETADGLRKRLPLVLRRQ